MVFTVYLAAGAVWVKLALAGLEQHAFRHDGGTDGLVTAPHRTEEEDEADQETADHQQSTGLHDWTLRRSEHCGVVSADGQLSGY